MSRFGNYAERMGTDETADAEARHERHRNYAQRIADAYDAAHHEIEDGAAMDLTRPDRFEQE